MAYILRVRVGDIELEECVDPGFCDWVKMNENAPLDDAGTNLKIDAYAGVHRTDRDEFAFKILTGRLLARAAFFYIKENYKVCRRSSMDGVMVERLGMILTRASDSCIFSKIGNMFLFQYFRAHLSPPRCALLIPGETPFREVGEQLDEDCNKIVRPVTDTLCKDQFLAIDWRTTTDPFHFILAASVLKEIVDDKIDIFVNTEISFAEATKRPGLFAASSFDPFGLTFGVVADKTVYHHAVEFPVFADLVDFVMCRSSGGESFALLRQCLEEDVENIEATNPFKKYIN